MHKEIKVLMLEDNSSDALIVLRILKKNWDKVYCERVYSARDMKRYLFTEDWDIIISDYSMPQFTGLDGLKILQDSGLDIPFIMVSGTMSEEVAVEVMKAGAGDYILKDRLHRLVPAIERELEEKLLRYNHRITSKALLDSEALSQAVRDGPPIGITVRDRNGTLILSNKTWQEIWGFSQQHLDQLRKKRDKLRFDKYDAYLGVNQSKVKKVYEEGQELFIPEIRINLQNRNKTNWISQHFYALKNKNDEVERVLVLTEDITKRKEQELRQNLTHRILHILNKQGNWKTILHRILIEIRLTMNYESLGLRLKQGDDFPYIETIGFRDNIAEHECYSIKKEGKNAGLDCLCGKVLGFELDVTLPYLTENGSFWTNNLPELVDENNDKINQLINRYNCVKEGYKSVALIPMIAGSEVLGLIQINDRNKNKFDKEMIKYLEEIGSIIAIENQRVESEKQVIAQEKQFRSLFENAVIGIFRLSSDCNILMMNPCLLDFLGFESLTEFKKSHQSPADDFRRITRKLFNNIQLDSDHVYDYEASWIRQDGKSIYVRTTAKTVKDKAGNIVYIDGTVEDRTDRMKAMQALLESREMYRSLVEKANVGIVTDNLQGEITYFNNKFAELFGYSSNEMSKLSYKDLFCPDDMDLMLSYHNLHVNGEIAPPRFELKGNKKDGSSIVLEIAVDRIHDDEFNIEGTRAFVWDITEHKQAIAIQRALYNISMAFNSTDNLEILYLKLKENLGTVIDTTNIFVALYDEENDELSLPFEIDERDHFESFPAGKSLTSYLINHGKPLLLKEQDIYDLVEAGEVDLIGTAAQIWLGAPLQVHEKTIGVIVVQSYDNPNLYTAKDLQILSIVSNEIATSIDKKRAEENLRLAHEELKKLHKSLEEKVKQEVAKSREKDHIIMQQSRQVAIGEMISSIAHHWRQPLNVIGVTFQSVREAFEYGELTSEYMEEKTEIILNILQSLSKTIDDFIFFHQQKASQEDFDLKETIEKTIYTIRRKFENSNIKLKVDLDGGMIRHGVKTEYSQVVLNILTNAYDILIDRKVKNPEVQVKLKNIEERSILSIHDNGGGVEENIIENIFELYTSTKKNLNNTGIGLYIARLIIEKHLKGSLKLINHADGAEFIVEV